MANTFAQIVGGAVVNVALANQIEDLPQGLTWVDIHVLSPMPGIGWSYNGSDFTPPAPPDPPILSIRDQAFVRLRGTIELTSASHSGLDGTYRVDQAAQANITATVVYLMKNEAFPGGGDTISWADAIGQLHEFPSPTAFEDFASSVADYIAALNLIAATGTGPLPSSALSIA